MNTRTRDTYHIKVTHNGITAIDLLAQHTPFSKTRLKKIMNCGAVWLKQGNKTRRIRRAQKKLSATQELFVYYQQEIIDQNPKAATLIADHQQYSIWCKPSGVFSQGTRYGDHCTLLRYAQSHLTPQRNAFIVHRLDRDASGLMIIAHSKQAAACFSQLFREGKISKFYQARVKGQPQFTLPCYLTQPLDGKKSQTIIEALDYNPDTNTSLLHIQLVSGRKHQIRRHLAQIGFPIIGDRLYGADKATDYNIGLQLQAVKLEFICPFQKQKMVIVKQA